jgi:PAS domain-containing protein
MTPTAELSFAIGEVAAMLGISPHTIRAWERRHLVVRPMRTRAGQRRYSAEDVELLRQIKHERHVHGLSMRVATLTAQGLVVPDTGEPGPAAGAPPMEAGADPLRIAADLVPELVVVVDARGRVAHANTAFARFCSVTVGQLRGVPFADFVDPFDRAKAVSAYQEPLRQRRDWELNLCTSRRRAFFSFDCWPISSGEGPMLVLVGRDLTVEPAPPEALDGPPTATAAGAEGGVATRLCSLLDGAADPARTLGLARRWLDATPLGIVLAGVAADLPVVFANRAFRAWLPPERLPAEGRPWRALRPEAEGEAGRLALAAAEAARTGRPRTVRGPRPAGGAAMWDVEVAPVAGADGRVTHLVLVVADVSAERVAGGLDVLAACSPALRRAGEPGQVMRTAARHAPDLLPNAGSLLAAATGGDVSVVAASGVWSRAERGAERDLRLALVDDAVRTCASIEVARSGGGGDVETLRVVPLAERGRALGAVAFSRVGEGSFTIDDRLLIDEFAGRIALALRRVV